MLVKFEKERISTGDIEVSLQTKKNKPILRVLKGALALLDENSGHRCISVDLCGDSKNKDLLYIVPSTEPNARRLTRDDYTGTLSLGKRLVTSLDVEVPTISLRLPASWDKKTGALKISLEAVRTVLKHAKPEKAKPEIKSETKVDAEASDPGVTGSEATGTDGKQKRKRRTKAEMEAAKAAAPPKRKRRTRAEMAAFRAAEAVNPFQKRTRRTKAEMAAERAATDAEKTPADGEPATTEGDPFGRQV
jgi:hypothetical protein